MTAARAEGRTIAVLCGYCFALLMSYGFARPSIESLYVDAYTSEGLPAAWIGVAVAAAAVTAVYGRFAGRMELTALFGRVIAVVLVVLAALLAAVRFEVPGAVYLLYLWKDLYIVVLVEMFWTVANHHFELKRARWLYGFFCAMGALGGIVANGLVGRVATALGTESAPLLVFPLLGVCGLLTRWMPVTHKAAGERAPTDLLAGLRVIRRSGYLGLLLAVIAAVQVVVTLVDYQFNVVVEASYPDRDVRTGVVGQVYLYIEVASFALQVGTGLVVRLLGVTGTLLAIPLVLGGTIAAFFAAPRFLTMAVAKVASKALDYSVFRAAKEMLYLPLDYAEQTQGKAVVDILTYRVAKGATSALLLGLAAVGAPAMAATGAALVLVGVWVALVGAIVRRYRQRMAERA
ncbi:MAG: hypothetical protein H6703_09770 [Myxococcales bacterium]|nr:hypothetical protein [Myxococcales bacterium]MCB9542722.1 hypothetical protein [Myxococcales bacterium]